MGSLWELQEQPSSSLTCDCVQVFSAMPGTLCYKEATMEQQTPWMNDFHWFYTISVRYYITMHIVQMSRYCKNAEAEMTSRPWSCSRNFQILALRFRSICKCDSPKTSWLRKLTKKVEQDPFIAFRPVCHRASHFRIMAITSTRHMLSYLEPFWLSRRD